MTVVAYANSLYGRYIYEDLALYTYDDVTLPGPAFRSWLGWRAAAVDVYAVPARSLTRLSLDLTRLVAGTDAPFPARIVSVGWHLLNGLLFWFLAQRLVTPIAALLAVGTFLLHPLQVESVAYIASRPELVVGMWVLLALLTADAHHVWLALLCAALAITGKEHGVVALLLIPLWAMTRRQSWPRAMIALWVLVTGVLFTLFAIHAQRLMITWSLWYVAGQLTALGRLLLLLPEALMHPSALTIDHDWSWITKPIATIGTAGWLIALVSAFIVRSRSVLFALCWVLLACAPRLLITMPDGLHERHLYTAMIGICLGLALCLTPQQTTRMMG